MQESEAEALHRLAAQALHYAAERMTQVREEPVSEDAASSEEKYLLFSPTEEAILAAVPVEGWMTAELIAEAIDEPLEGDLKPLLRNLVARKALRSAQGRGYRRRA
jgi:hypothetical protein